MNIEQVKNWFPKELEEMLVFEDVRDYIKIKPRQYLGSENFAKIAAIVRDNKGEYISAGKDSHFRVEKGKVMSTATATKQDALKKDLWAYVDSVENHADSIKKQAEIIKEKLKEMQK